MDQRPTNALERVIDHIVYFWLGGYSAAHQGLAPKLKAQFLLASAQCRRTLGGPCNSCPDCPCAQRALKLVGITPQRPSEKRRESMHPSHQRGKAWKGLPKEPSRQPQPPTTPDVPSKQPAVAMPRPQAPTFTDAVAKEAKKGQRAIDKR